ncbi:hypothetical protein SDC9_140467 [bioreactor metagenome]|uniref:Uncharacterized protein n=1 Tax=bioreactor metagenome TaxID=1076179 RepID=A0A645DUZ4_9ZZZZ
MRAGRAGGGPGQVVEDGAVRPVIAMAAMHQSLQRALHGLHGGDAFGQRGDVLLRDGLDLAAGAALVLPQAEQGGDLVHGKAQIAPAADEAQRMHIGFGVLAIAAVGTVHGWQQAQ